MCMLFGSFFMFSNFYQLYLHNITRVALANLPCTLCKTQIENRISLDLVMVIGSACLLISYHDTQVLPSVFIVECIVVVHI